MLKCNFETDVKPLVIELADWKFRQSPDKAEQIADAVSVAWELSQTAPESATPKSVAYYAVRRVSVRRHFRESARSTTGPNPRRKKKPERVELKPVIGHSPDPAVLAALLIDWAAFFATLSERKQRMVDRMIQGDRTEELAPLFQLSPGRISQVRREIVEAWWLFRS